MIGSGTIHALGAAFLFGASTPVAKLLGENIHPLVLAGLLYLGAGTGLGIWLLLRPSGLSAEASLRRRDLPYLAGAILLGGAAGPALLMTGLQQMSASTASLLLNLEGVFTVAVARLSFREHVPFRILAGMLLIVAGGSLPSLPLSLQVALVGTLGYGFSLAMFIASLCGIGAARAGGYFSTAPFVGAFLSVVLLRDAVHATLVPAAILMAVGGR